MIEKKTSPELNELFAAMAQVQSQIKVAERDEDNPHYKSRYTSFSALKEAVKGSLEKNGISILQFPGTDPSDSNIVLLETWLCHKSGQYIVSSISAKNQNFKNACQGLGSAITYLRRYSYESILGIASKDDDDGNAAGTSKDNLAVLKSKPSTPAVSANQLKRLFTLQNSSTISVDDLRLILKSKFNLESTKSLTLDQYNIVCEILEKNAIQDDDLKSI